MGIKATVNTSRLSPAAIERHKRRAKALELRSTGASFQAISEELGISVPTAFRDVEKAVKDLIPPETASQVVIMDIARFDAMITKYYPLALDGDQKSAELVLKISHQRARLLGLYPADGQPSLHFHAHSENAEAAGIKVEFVKPDPAVLEANPIPTGWDPPPLRQIGQPMPDYRFMTDREPPRGVAVKATTTAQPVAADAFVNPPCKLRPDPPASEAPP